MAFIINLLFTFLYANVVTTPKNCLDTKTEKCSVWNKNSDGFEFLNGDLKLLLQPNAIVTMSNEEVELISGNVFVSTGEKAKQIASSYATFVCTKCQAQFVVVKGKLHVKNLEGNLTYKTVTSAEFSDFPVGFETNFYTVDALTGKSRQEVFSPLDVTSAVDFFKDFSSEHEYTDRLKKREAFYKTKAKEASEIYKVEAERQIAQEQASKARMDQIKAENDKERADLRKMYRQKNYLE
ncbi:MAG: hypothetical protein KDD37_04265 [Bdellovibrionales bacterium]|nr:hypothetical protein [Bdellovibrionales bacterium]